MTLNILPSVIGESCCSFISLSLVCQCRDKSKDLSGQWVVSDAEFITEHKAAQGCKHMQTTPQLEVVLLYVCSIKLVSIAITRVGMVIPSLTQRLSMTMSQDFSPFFLSSFQKSQIPLFRKNKLVKCLKDADQQTERSPSGFVLGSTGSLETM